MRLLHLAPLCAALLLGGCDQLGIESASAVAARKEADGKAIGAGCRHAARSVEDCYANNKRAEKAPIFAGWKEMNDYMRENNIEAVPAGRDTAVAAAWPRSRKMVQAGEKTGDKAADKGSDKAAAKTPAKPKPAARRPTSPEGRDPSPQSP
jgi:hypothetical protein